MQSELRAIRFNTLQKADRAMRIMSPAEKRFFINLFQGEYVREEDRGDDWQGELEIRQELARELYG